MRPPKTTTTAWVMVSIIGTYYRNTIDYEYTPAIHNAQLFERRRDALAEKRKRAKDCGGQWLVRGDRPMRVVLENT